jgi:hypothetical protein
MSGRSSIALLLAGLLLGSAPVSNASLPLPKDARTVIRRMLRLNPSLKSYQARVHVDLRMLNFPFLAPQLDGTTYYKRPDRYEVVFDHVPAYAHGFEKIFDDVGDPLRWEREQHVALLGERVLNGRNVLVLSMTKKIYSTILARTIAYIDPANYELVEMEWDYRDGGKIVMRQWYGTQGQYIVVVQQHVDINIPHVHAVGDSQYVAYKTNVPLTNSVFEKL